STVPSTPLPAQVVVPAVQPPPILRSCAPVIQPPVQVPEKDSNIEQNLALRSGRFFHRRYPQTQQPQANTAEPTEAEEEPTSMYDLLKQLDQTPAKITILDLIRRSRSHQEEMYKFLQRVMVDESLPPERIIGALLTFHNGPLITFSDEELAPRELRTLPLCIVFAFNGTLVDSTLIDTRASVNVCPLSTMRLCGISESEMKPTSTTVAAYDNTRRPCHGTIDIKLELGPLVIPATFFIVDIDPAYKAILGRTFLSATGAVPST